MLLLLLVIHKDITSAMCVSNVINSVCTVQNIFFFKVKIEMILQKYFHAV